MCPTEARTVRCDIEHDGPALIGFTSGQVACLPVSDKRSARIPWDGSTARAERGDSVITCYFHGRIRGIR